MNHFLLQGFYKKPFFIFFLSLPLLLQSQSATLPINALDQSWYNNSLLRADHNDIHTAIHPYRTAEVSPYSRKSALLKDSIYKEKGLVNYIQRKLWQEHLFEFKAEDYHITINPVVGFSYGQDSEAVGYETTYQNSRGFHLEGRLGERFTFYSTFVENQARYPFHVNTLSQQQNVIPALWSYKDFKTNGFDYAYAAGEIAYTAKKFFHFRLGRGRQHIGEGYRSLLVSNQGVNYPFFRIETTIGKLRYVNVWSVMNDIRDTVALAPDVYAKKYFSMHYLSLNIGQRLNVGLFEGIMWGDELNRYGFDINFFNPVILYRPIEFSQGFTGGNVLMGLNASYRLGKGIKVYGQMALDEFVWDEITDWKTGHWRNMMAWQIGAKWGDALGIENLFVRAELNAVRPHVYSHRDIVTNWAHYNQALAHPWGANFKEWLVHAEYRKGRLLARAAIHGGLRGRDENEAANWGGNIYKSYSVRSADKDVFIGNGVESKLMYWRAELNFIANPNYNLRLQLGYQSRSEDATELGLPDSKAFYFGLRTNIYEAYQDF